MPFPITQTRSLAPTHTVNARARRRLHTNPIALLGLAMLMLAPLWASAQAYSTQSGSVSFTSDAPMEVIKAASNTVGAAIVPTNRTFAFSVKIASFQGFNSELQREHFNDKYMQSGTYAYGTFKGKIVEEVDLTQNGTYNVRAKGILNIRGKEKERTINAKVVVANGVMTVTSTFDILLSDHGIEIEAIISQKIAKTVYVTVNCTLKKS